MRNLSELELEGLIVHALDTENESEAQLSEASLPPPPATDVRVFDYFRSNILVGLADTQARTARFESLASDRVAVLAQLVQGEGTFVAASQRLAEALFEIMRGDRRISAGDLVVATYSGVLDGTREKFVAVMKIDPTSALRQMTLTDDSGRSIISFDVVQGLLPTDGEKLQKAAFIRPIEPRGEDDYDLLMLDRQVRPVDREKVALFFSQRFLATRPSVTPRELTHRLLDTLERVQRMVSPELPDDDERDRLREKLAAATKQRHVNLDRLPLDLELPRELSEKVAKQLGVKRFADREFTIDQDVVESKQRRVTVYHGDYGLRVEVPRQFSAERFEVEEVTDEPGRRPYHRVVIETETWRVGT